MSNVYGKIPSFNSLLKRKSSKKKNIEEPNDDWYSDPIKEINDFEKAQDLLSLPKNDTDYMSDSMSYSLHTEEGLLLYKKIGEGSYSVVSETYWEETNKTLVHGATKLLFFDEDLLKSGCADFFVNELFCSSSLRNRKSIFAFKNFGKTYNHLKYGIHMELYPYDLYSMIKFSETCPPPLELVKYVIKECTLALQRVHDAGIMHRDVKPENFMIGSDFTVELIDFSLSTFRKKSLNYKVVTLWWRPLDVLIRSYEYDNKVDIWSLGLVFLEFIKGKKMFCSNSEKNIAISILTQFGFPSEKNWPELHTCFPNIDKSGMKPLDPHIKYCLPYEVEERYKGILPLLDACLNVNPNKRASCKEILSHPFLMDTPCRYHDFQLETKIWIDNYKKFRENIFIEKKNSHSVNYTLKYPTRFKTENDDVKNIFTNKSPEFEESFMDEKAVFISKKREDLCNEIIHSFKNSLIIPLLEKCKIEKLEKNNMNMNHTRLFFLAFMYSGYSPLIYGGHLVIISLYFSCVLTSDVYPSLYKICKMVNNEPIEKLFSDCVTSLNIFLESSNCCPPSKNLLHYISNLETLDWIYN